MPKKLFISQNVAMILVYSRPFLAFAGMICAISVMLTRNPIFYILGVSFLFVAMTFDLVDGWFDARFLPHSKLSHLADRIMDKSLYSILFPVVAVGTLWQYSTIVEVQTKQGFLHVIFVLILCVTVLIRDNFAHFMRNFAIRKGHEEERSEITRLRTIVATPVGAILYANAFYVPEGPESPLYFWISWLGNIPMRVLFFIEIAFLIINFGSIAAYSRKYGQYFLDELCLGDEILRRRILAFFPNALTVMNATMGILAIVFVYSGRVREAFLLLIGAALFDKLDGSLARKLGLTEPPPNAKKTTKKYISFGSILDDISDAVSFCIAPAVIFYLMMSKVEDPLIQSLPYEWVSILYAGLGIARLIYFTLDTTPIPGFFKGLPTPAAALFVGAFFIPLAYNLENQTVYMHIWGYLGIGLMILIAILMNVYPIHYLHFGRLMSRKPWITRSTVLAGVIFVFTPYFGYFAFTYLLVYILSPLFTWKIPTEIASKESRSTS